MHGRGPGDWGSDKVGGIEGPDEFEARDVNAIRSFGMVPSTPF